MNILITEKEFQEYRKLQQEKEELIKWIENEIKQCSEKYEFWKERYNYSMMGDYDTKCQLLNTFLSKLKESE